MCILIISNNITIFACISLRFGFCYHLTRLQRPTTRWTIFCCRDEPYLGRHHTKTAATASSLPRIVTLSHNHHGANGGGGGGVGIGSERATANLTSASSNTAVGQTTTPITATTTATATTNSLSYRTNKNIRMPSAPTNAAEQARLLG